MSPKVAGGWNVHRLADRRRVEWCVAFSAGATLLGSPGQANYAAANAFLDALVAQRRAVGLPGASIQWGAWSQVGMAARLDERSRRRWAERGMDAIEPGAGARLALRLLEWPGGTVAVLPARWDAYRSAIPESTRRLLTEVVKPPGADAPTARGAATASARTLGDALRDVPAQAREETLLDRLRQLAQGVLGVTGVDQLPADRPLREIGLDSLMAVELRNAVSAAVGRSLPATLLFDYPTLRGLAGYVGGVLFGAQATDPGGASDREKAGPTAATVSDVRAMTDAQAEELLILELGGQTTRGTDG